ncbi:DUF2939 domain-containing protein [Luteimonas sp. MC1750]|uniref:DUF2939 domain-containing protein n=1 Tax=Luteimonas sp. MC1750 TaxID=2799326 RepID=UPI0018F0FE2D|nr:DUF2939 domain-containing protein [Luteimonas sp. MC1750]MBJ6984588.1 DUF2939 domain-containing protein [Luteimonas sp. MC1750]QQO04807.1 DUF2939 domain-containing protein [Luteimonas sp. MC1750]
MTDTRRLRLAGWIVAAVLLALLAWTASGPWRAVAGIRQAVDAGDARALARYVDFPALRASLKPQVQDRIVRAAGVEAQTGPFAAFGLTVATGLAGGLVDAMVTPTGLAALMEGRKVWERASNEPPRSRAVTGTGATGSARADAAAASATAPRLRYESLSRSSAIVTLDDGSALTLVLTRQGLRWRLSEIRLPPADAPGATLP